MGLPITEAYWSRFTVAGVSREVLVQAFERRILTFTPSNPAQYQVEMGNVGRHYFTWRYSSRYDLPGTSLPVSGGPSGNPAQANCSNLTPATNGAFAFTPCGAAGMQIVVGMNNLTPGEKASITPVTSAGDTRPPMTITVDLAGAASAKFNTLTTDPVGIWSFRIQGQTSGKQGVAYVYVGPPVFVFPEKGDVNTLFALIFVGFQPNEFVIPHLTTPEQLSGFGDNVQSNAGGGFTISFRVGRDIPGEFGKPGMYRITLTSQIDATRYAQATLQIAPAK